MSVFGPTYAQSYDAFYASKDYAGECNLVENLIRKHAGTPGGSLLDIGCGTGGHAIELAKRSFKVTGIDLSASMLELAKAKACLQKVCVRFEQGNACSFSFGQKFDTALMMFAVLGYQHDNRDVLGALRNVRLHLNPGGLFIFDVWHGPAVLKQRPDQRFRSFPTDKGEILRAASGCLDVNRHLCAVHYDIWCVEQDRIAGREAEEHVMRFFFPQEISLFLSQAGLDLIQIGQMDAPDLAPTENSWNVVCVARAI